MMLALQIYSDASRGRLLADYTGRAQGVQFSSNLRGFSYCRVRLIPMTLLEAFRAYEWPGTPHLTLTNRFNAPVWEGRLEDIAIVSRGLSLVAMGYQRAMSDIPYTAFWSASGTAGWGPVTGTDITGRTPERYVMDNNNRLYIAPKKGESFGHTQHNGDMSFAVPHLGVRGIKSITADYDMLLPADWALRILTSNDDFSGLAVESTITATGSAQTGSISLDVTEKPRIQVGIWNATGSTYNNTSETGTFYVRLTNVRVKSVAKGSSVLASDIVASLVAYVSGLNPAQLSTATSLIQATTPDLLNESYEDIYPNDILDELSLSHSYSWSIWENRRLRFEPRESNSGRAWAMDIAGNPELQRSLNGLYNQGYALYQNANGRTLRTSAAIAADSDWTGIVRRGSVKERTTSASRAEEVRDAWLEDASQNPLRAALVVSRINTQVETQGTPSEVRAGDVVRIRNLPPTLSADLREISTFRVGETSYDADSGMLKITPEIPIPTLVTLTAANARGRASA